MASKAEIEASVLKYFRAKWPLATRKTRLREDLLLVDDQIVDIGTELAEKLGCNPTRTQIRKCKTVGDLIDLLVATSQGEKSVKKSAKKSR